MSKKGTSYEKLDCTKSGCNGTDTLQVFQQGDGSFDGTCFKCGTFYPDPYTDGREPGPAPVQVTPQEVEAQLAEITGYRCLEIEHRAISGEVVDYLGIRVATSPVSRSEIVTHYYPYYEGTELKRYKVRIVDGKRFFALGYKRQEVDAFGWKQALETRTRKLIICEDELSTASVIDALLERNKGTQYEGTMPAVISLPSGTGSAASMIERHRSVIENKWQEVVLVLDQDEAGFAAEDVIIGLLQGSVKVTVVRLPLKDPNDMVMANRGKELAESVLFRGQIKRYDGIKDVTDFLDKATTPPARGIDWPWPTVTAKTFGIREGEVHIIGAAPKIGKTDHQHTLVEWLASEYGLTVLVMDLENPGHKTLRRLAGKFAHKAYHRPDVHVEDGEIAKAAMLFNGKVKFYDSSNDRDWDSVKKAIMSSYYMDGTKYVVIDPLTALISELTSGDANDALNKIMTEVSGIALKYGITFFVYSHLNPPKNGAPHEDGGRVLSSQFTGSRAMEKWANYGWGIERNRNSDDPEERNTSYLVLLFDREYGEQGRISLVYDAMTNSYKEPTYGDDF